mmetsp:Transcript_67831/g.164006  ORF Transcript_67831/g.164006 Transcript_67831/m.164006 type:complete len:249 (-) Transcript_67831:275-1021(-)
MTAGAGRATGSGSGSGSASLSSAADSSSAAPLSSSPSMGAAGFFFCSVTRSCGLGRLSSSSKPMVSTHTKSCQSMVIMALRSASSTVLLLCAVRSRSRTKLAYCWMRVSVRNRSSLSLSSRCLSSSWGARHLEYASTRDVKYEKRKCVGLRKSNMGFLLSRLARPVRKERPLRATNCAVSMITSISSGCAPAGRLTMYCGLGGSKGITPAAAFLTGLTVDSPEILAEEPAASTEPAGGFPPLAITVAT